MLDDRSFTDYIKTRFYNPIYSAVNDLGGNGACRQLVNLLSIQSAC